MYQPSPKRLETWRSQWPAKGELAFPGKGAQPPTKLNAEPISELNLGSACSGQPTMEIDFSKKGGVSGNILCQSPSMAAPTL